MKYRELWQLRAVWSLTIDHGRLATFSTCHWQPIDVTMDFVRIPSSKRCWRWASPLSLSVLPLVEWVRRQIRNNSRDSLSGKCNANTTADSQSIDSGTREGFSCTPPVDPLVFLQIKNKSLCCFFWSTSVATCRLDLVEGISSSNSPLPLWGFIVKSQSGSVLGPQLALDWVWVHIVSISSFLSGYRSNSFRGNWNHQSGCFFSASERVKRR